MKAINLILGLGTAVILSSLIFLGINVFYPRPEYPEYPSALGIEYDSPEYKAERATYDRQVDEYEADAETYGRDVFIIANIVGLLVFGAGFLILFVAPVATRSVPVGIMLAGMFSIIRGYFEGWWATDDKIKFFVGLAIAVIVIGGSMWLIQRYTQRHAEPRGETKS